MITKYTKLTNIEVPSNYECNDSGIFLLQKNSDGTKTKKVYLGEALSIIGLYIDVADGKEYTVFEYFDIHTKKSKKVSIKSSSVKKGNFDELFDGSYEVGWLDGFKSL